MRIHLKKDFVNGVKNFIRKNPVCQEATIKHLYISCGNTDSEESNDYSECSDCAYD